MKLRSYFRAFLIVNVFSKLKTTSHEIFAPFGVFGIKKPLLPGLPIPATCIHRFSQPLDALFLSIPIQPYFMPDPPLGFGCFVCLALCGRASEKARCFEFNLLGFTLPGIHLNSTPIGTILGQLARNIVVLGWLAPTMHNRWSIESIPSLFNWNLHKTEVSCAFFSSRFGILINSIRRLRKRDDSIYPLSNCSFVLISHLHQIPPKRDKIIARASTC